MSQFIRLQFPDKNSGAEFNSSKPPYSDLDYDKSLVFANRNLVLNLDNTNHTVAKFRISWAGNVDYASICFYDGNGSMVSVSDSPGGLYKVCFPPDMYLENTFKDEQNNTQNREYYVVLNGDPSQKTDTLNIVVSVASSNKTQLPSAEVSILYDCSHAPVYEYETGMHVYSSYDAKADTAALTTKLYSTTPIANWSTGTKIWQHPLLSTPAMPYFYGYDDKVYQVGTEVDRSYGFKTQIVMHKPKRSFKKSWRTETIGPQSFYDDTDPNNETSQACIEPTLSGVGKLRRIFTASTLSQPQQYRYYMGYHATNKRESNDSVFTKYILADKKHYPITGFQHATEKMVSAIFSGFNRNLKPLFIGAAALGVAGLALLVPAVGTAIASTAAGVSAFFSGLIGPFAPALISIGSGLGGAMAAVATFAPYILLAAALIYAAIKFFSKVTKVYKEDCKNFLHHFTTNPYIGTGNVLYKDNNLSIVNNGFYCDGVNYYQQSGGSVTTKELSFTNALVNEDPKEFKFLHSIQADDPTLVEDLGKLILLPYASGKPMPYCGGSTVYYSSLKTQTITTECCDFETCDPVTIEVPYGTYVSCVSQQEADNQAEEQLEQAVGWAQAQGTYITTTEDATDFNAQFTHEIRIEDRPNVSAVFYTGSIGIGNTLYYDAFGCHKVLDGYYTTGSSTYYKEFYHTVDGVIDNIEYITTSGSTTTDSSIPLLGYDQNFTSNWFISGSNRYAMDAYTNQNWFWDRNFDTTTIKTNSSFKPVTGYIISSSYNDFRVFPSIGETGSTEEALSGYYKPLIDWYYQDSFYYNAISEQIVLTPTEVCTFDLDSPLRQFSINSTIGGVAYEASNPLVVDYTVVYTSSEYQALPSEYTIPVAPETASQVNLDVIDGITDLSNWIFPLGDVMYYQEVADDQSTVNVYRNTISSLPLPSNWKDSSELVIPDSDILTGFSFSSTFKTPIYKMFKSGSNDLFAFGSANFLTSTDNGLNWSHLPREAVNPDDSWKLDFRGVGAYSGAWMDGDSILVTSNIQYGGGTINRYWYSKTRGQTWYLSSLPQWDFGGMNMANSPGIDGGATLNQVVSHNGKWFVNVFNSKQLVSTTTPEDDTSWVIESTEDQDIDGLWVSDNHLFMSVYPNKLIRYNLDSSGNLSNRKSVGNIPPPYSLGFNTLSGNSNGTDYKHQYYIPNPTELMVRQSKSFTPSPYDYPLTFISRDLGDTWTRIGFSPNQGQQAWGDASNWNNPSTTTNGFLWNGVHYNSTTNAYFAGMGYGGDQIGILSGKGLGLAKKLVDLYSGSYNGSITLNPNLSENLIDFSSSINGDTNEIDIILDIPGSNRIGNIEYEVEDYESCNIDRLEDCGTNINATSDDPSKSFPRKQAIYLSGSGAGEVTISFTSSVVPVKPIFEYNGTIVGDGGYRGSQIYQTDLNNELTRRGESTQTISSRYYEVTFTKDSFIPDFVTASFYAPLSSSSWEYNVNCPITLNPVYKIAPSIPLVNEGNSVTWTIETKNIAPDTTLYYKNSGTINGSDFTDGLNEGSIVLSNNEATLTKTLVEDLTTEGDETIIMQLRTGSTTGTIVTSSSTVDIYDASPTPVPTYDISPNKSVVDEGDSVTWTITTSDIPANSILYYTNSGTTNASDFTDGVNQGSIQLSNNTATLTKTLVEDASTEGGETIILQLRTDSTSGTIVKTSPTTTVNDTSTTPVYDISPNITSVNEGQSVTWTITTSNIPSNTTLYYTNSGTTNGSDFTDGVNQGSIQLTNNIATLTKTLVNDFSTEGDETIILQLRTDSTSGTIVKTSTTVIAKDTSKDIQYSYTLYVYNNVSGRDSKGRPYDVDISGGNRNIEFRRQGSKTVTGAAGSSIIITGDVDRNPSEGVKPTITSDFNNLSSPQSYKDDWSIVVTMPTGGGTGRISIAKAPPPVVWSNENPLTTARSFAAAAGTQDATVIFGGATYPTSTGALSIKTTEEYNGIEWSNSNNMSVGRAHVGGAGTQNAAIAIGGTTQQMWSTSLPAPGTYSNLTEEYGGANWTTGCNLNIPRGMMIGMSSGTQNSALVAGGQVWTAPNSCYVSNATEEFNGLAWTTVPGTLCNQRMRATMFGTQNSSTLVSGVITDPSSVRCTEEYNGTSWSTGGPLNNPRFHLSGAGTSANSGVVYGEGNRTEEYNGVSWTDTHCMNQSSGARAGSGTKSAALASGGWLNVTCTEEYNP